MSAANSLSLHSLSLTAVAAAADAGGAVCAMLPYSVATVSPGVARSEERLKPLSPSLHPPDKPVVE